MAVQIQLRNDTAANWTAANPTLAAGEVGIETDTGSVKVGNGTTSWSSLPYFGVSSTYVNNAISNIVDSAPATLNTLNELAAALNDDANFATTITNTLANKQDIVANVSNTEIGYLDGVTSAIQTQLNDKAPINNPAFTGTVSGNASAASTAANGANALGFKGIPTTGQGGNHTLIASDAGKLHYFDSSAKTLTIPSNSSVPFEIGTTIVVINGGGGNNSIAITSDTLTLAGQGTTGTRTLANHGMATMVKVASTTWYISGNGLT